MPSVMSLGLLAMNLVAVMLNVALRYKTCAVFEPALYLLVLWRCVDAITCIIQMASLAVT